MANIFDRLFNVDGKRIRELEKKVAPIEALEDKYEQMSDEDLKNETVRLKALLKEGKTLDDILVEAFATAREACRRVLHEYPYHEQLMGGIVIHEGDIAEMKTGEGKTLTSVMPVYLNALSGNGVHIITVNEYLSERDAGWMGEIHRFLGLTVGVNKRQLSPAQKRAAYDCDITYTTNSELGFDYLRDNMVKDVKDRVQRDLNYALIDEVDSILIDESRTPLIISGGMKQTANLYLQADRFVKHLKPKPVYSEEILKEMELAFGKEKDERIKNGEKAEDIGEFVVHGDYEVDIKTKTVLLTEEGIAKAERAFRKSNLYDMQNAQLLHRINQALKANYTMDSDVEYVVDDENDEIHIVDPNTGRLMKGREWSDGLHQAVCAKEGISINQETTVLATITYQNFFRLYNKIGGMTGTAKTEEEEFHEIYNMLVYVIPTHKPIARIDRPDMVFGSKDMKYAALVKEVQERHEKGQPVLVGTIAVETSDHISKLLKEAGVKHEVLNAKNHLREAEIIAKAGKKGSVTIATNMAGRGTDIKLGEGVRELGGLCVLGSERHESRRIDNQLRGRSGRQGDPGESIFFVSIEDDLMKRFGSERMEGLFNKLTNADLDENGKTKDGEEFDPRNTAIESKTVSKSINSAQKRVEGVNFDARKTLLQYDDVLRQQREVMYEQRNYILENADIEVVLEKMFKRVISDYVAGCTDYTSKQPSVDLHALWNAIDAAAFDDGYDFSEEVLENNLSNATNEEVVEWIYDRAWNGYQAKVKDHMDEVNPWQQKMALTLIDRAWVDHIDTMSKLRDGIGLRSYAQSNPLQAYVTEGYQLFETMMADIAKGIVNYCMHHGNEVAARYAEVQQEVKQEEVKED